MKEVLLCIAALGLGACTPPLAPAAKKFYGSGAAARQRAEAENQ